MKSSIITLPFKFLVHKCDKTNCNVDPQIEDLNYNGQKMRIHPPFLTGNENDNVFPNLLKKDLTFLGFSGNGEVPFVQLKKTYKHAKDANTFQLDYLTEYNDMLEWQIVNGIVRHFKVISNQYWLNSSIYQEQRLYRTYPIDVSGTNIEISASPHIFKMDGYIDMEVLHRKSWHEAVQSFEQGIEIIGHEKFLDAINYYHYGYLDSMILNLILSSEIAKNKLFKTLWMKLNPGSNPENYDDREVGLYNNTITEHIDKNLKEHLGKSFKVDNPEEFKLVQYCWKFRGKISHGEKPIIDHDTSNIKLEDLQHLKLIHAILKLNKYLNDILVSI